MKAALYMRVSSEEQVDNFSLAAQLNELNAYCIKNNIEVYNAYRDEGLSGTKEDRPAFQKMISDAEKKLFDVILVHKFDRFARKVEISQRIKSRLKKASVNVISITEPIEDSPIGFFQEGLLELLSEYFIKNLSSEIKKGQKERASQGKHHGSVPFGYRTKDGEAYIIEAEAEIVRTIFRMYLEGHGYCKIAMYLNSSNIKTLTGKYWRQYPICRILQNSTYAGYVSLNGQTYVSTIPPIISQEIFDEAQKQRGFQNKRYPYRTSRQKEYLLLGLLRCGECGGAMRFFSTKRKSGYLYTAYCCNVATQGNMAHKCTFARHFSTKKLDNKVLEAIYTIANDINIEIKTNRQTKIVNIVDNYADKLQKELKRAKEAYLGGVFDLTEYSQTRAKIEKDLKELETSQVPPAPDIRDDIKNMLQEFERLSEDDIINRKRTLQKIISYISIGPDGIEVSFH